MSDTILSEFLLIPVILLASYLFFVALSVCWKFLYACMWGAHWGGNSMTKRTYTQHQHLV